MCSDQTSWPAPAPSAPWWRATILDSKEYITVLNNQRSFIGSPNVEEWINHPAYISDRNTISAFIPFCSFGFKVDLIGEKLINFQRYICYLSLSPNSNKSFKLTMNVTRSSVVFVSKYRNSRSFHFPTTHVGETDWGQNWVLSTPLPHLWCSGSLPRPQAVLRHLTDNPDLEIPASVLEEACVWRPMNNLYHSNFR